MIIASHSSESVMAELQPSRFDAAEFFRRYHQELHRLLEADSHHRDCLDTLATHLHCHDVICARTVGFVKKELKSIAVDVLVSRIHKEIEVDPTVLGVVLSVMDKNTTDQGLKSLLHVMMEKAAYAPSLPVSQSLPSGSLVKLIDGEQCIEEKSGDTVFNELWDLNKFFQQVQKNLQHELEQYDTNLCYLQELQLRVSWCFTYVGAAELVAARESSYKAILEEIYQAERCSKVLECLKKHNLVSYFNFGLLNSDIFQKFINRNAELKRLIGEYNRRHRMFCKNTSPASLAKAFDQHKDHSPEILPTKIAVLNKEKKKYYFYKEWPAGEDRSIYEWQQKVQLMNPRLKCCSPFLIHVHREMNQMLCIEYAALPFYADNDENKAGRSRMQKKPSNPMLQKDTDDPSTTSSPSESDEIAMELAGTEKLRGSLCAANTTNTSARSNHSITTENDVYSSDNIPEQNSAADEIIQTLKDEISKKDLEIAKLKKIDKLGRELSSFHTSVPENEVAELRKKIIDLETQVQVLNDQRKAMHLEMKERDVRIMDHMRKNIIDPLFIRLRNIEEKQDGQLSVAEQLNDIVNDVQGEFRKLKKLN